MQKQILPSAMQEGAGMEMLGHGLINRLFSSSFHSLSFSLLIQFPNARTFQGLSIVDGNAENGRSST